MCDRDNVCIRVSMQCVEPVLICVSAMCTYEGDRAHEYASECV